MMFLDVGVWAMCLYKTHADDDTIPVLDIRYKHRQECREWIEMMQLPEYYGPWRRHSPAVYGLNDNQAALFLLTFS